MPVNAASDSSQQIVRLPGTLYNGTERIFLIDLTLTDSAGHIVSRNFYWVPYTLTTFDWGATRVHLHSGRAVSGPDRHDPAAAGQSELNAPKSAAPRRGARSCCTSTIHSEALAFQVEAAVRTSSGGLIAPVFWSDNWIELVPGESRTLTARLPDDAPANPVVKVRGWNIEAATLKPSGAAQP